MVNELTKAEFDDKVLKAELPVVIDFFADWCGPCQMLKPVFEEVSTELKDKMTFFKVDTDKEGELSTQMGIRGIPALIIFKEGKQIAMLTGFKPKEALKAELEKFL
jgi:thioredoxin 1